MTLQETITALQNELKVAKGKYNNFGKYKYRTAEDILKAVKPLLKKYKLSLVLSDEAKELGGVIIVESTAIITNEKGNELIVKAVAGVDPSKKGMDIAQSFGSSSSYARKFALNGIFLIDESEADPDAKKEETKEKPTLNDARFNKALEQIAAGNYTAEKLKEEYKLTETQLKAL